MGFAKGATLDDLLELQDALQVIDPKEWDAPTLEELLKLKDVVRKELKRIQANIVDVWNGATKEAALEVEKNMRNWNNPEKRVIRQELFKIKKNKRVAKTALFLPSHSCHCIKEALKQGVVDKNTYIVAVERDRELIDRIRTTLDELGFVDYVVLHKDLEKVKTFPIPSRVFDFVYIDTCKGLTRPMQAWIKDVLSLWINYKTTACFTFINADRTGAILGTLTSYKFSDRYPTNFNAQELVGTTQRLLSHRFKNVCLYGRAYKEQGVHMAMVTFKLGFGWRQKPQSGTVPYDLGYKQNAERDAQILTR